MIPVIFSLGPVHVYSYGLMLAVAVTVCAFLLKKDAAALNIPGDTLYDLVFWAVAGGLLGARIFFVTLNWDFFSGQPGEIFMIQNGGLAFQGGLLFGSAAAVIYLRLKKLPFWATTDLLAPYLALGQAIGRVGCFLNGCCYGRPFNHGIFFPVHQDYLHPTQL